MLSNASGLEPPGLEPRTLRRRIDSIVLDFCNEHCLTPRETQVMLLVCAGMTNVDIGLELDLSLPSIRLHIMNIHRKLGTSSKVQLLRRVIEGHLVGTVERTEA